MNRVRRWIWHSVAALFVLGLGLVDSSLACMSETGCPTCVLNPDGTSVCRRLPQDSFCGCIDNGTTCEAFGGDCYYN